MKGAPLERENNATELALEDPALYTFSSLAPLDSNVDSLEHGLLFANGIISHAAVVGPSGWGKTHLLEAIAERCRQRGQAVERRSLVSYLADPFQYDSPSVLLLDDVQEVLGKRKRRARLTAHLESRIQAGKPTFLCFTAPKVTRAIRTLIPEEGLWQLSTISAPPASERLAILYRMAGAQGLVLSPALAAILAARLGGNGRTLAGALNRLKLSSDTWDGPAETLHACGLLEPLFADVGDWDFARNMIAIAETNQHLVPCAAWQDLCLYTLLHICELCEMDVARALNMEPARAYTRVNRFRRTLSTSSEAQMCVGKFTELAISKLAPKL